MEAQVFFEIMTAFPTGVAVVTTLDRDGNPCGLTSNAVASVSADPPMLLVCVAKTSRTLPALVERRRFLVNFMAEGSHEVCALFASKASAEEKFARVEWTSAPATGHPHLGADAVAYVDCQIESEVEAGTHLILIGRVIEGAVTDACRTPIAYFRRDYCAWPVSD